MMQPLACKKQNEQKNKTVKLRLTPGFFAPGRKQRQIFSNNENERVKQ